MTEEELEALLMSMPRGGSSADVGSAGINTGMLDSPDAATLDASPNKTSAEIAGRPWIIGKPPSDKGNFLNSVIRGYGEGIVPGAQRNIIQPINAFAGAIEDKIRGTDQSFGEDYSRLYQMLLKENDEMKSKNPYSYVGAEIIGTLNPKSAFNQFLGKATVAKDASKLEKVLDWGARGTYAGGGTSLIKRIQDLINPDTSLDAVKNIGGDAVTSGAISAVVGPLADKYLVNSTEKATGAEDFLKDLKPYIGDVYKSENVPMPKQVFGELMEKYKDVPAATKYLSKFANSKAPASLFPDVPADEAVKKFSNLKPSKITEKAVNLSPEEKLVFRLLGRLKTTGNTVEDVQSLKSGDLVKDASKETQRAISNAAKKDILKAIFNKEGPQATKAMNKAYSNYSAMETVEQALNLTPSKNYLNVEGTLRNLDDVDKGMISKFVKEGKFDLNKLKTLLQDYSNTGVKQVKIPGAPGKNLRGILAGKDVGVLHNDVAQSVLKELLFQLMNKTGKAAPRAMATLPSLLK